MGITQLWYHADRPQIGLRVAKIQFYALSTTLDMQQIQIIVLEAA